MPVQPYLDDILKVAKANASVNPYAGLFDYDEMAKEEEARKLRLQEGQKRIQRTNAIGDALRLLSEGVTGSMGASIAPRAVNPGIMQASQRINALEDQSQGNMDRLRLQDLAMREKGLSYDLGQKATQQQRDWEAGQTEAKNKFAESQLNKELGSREKIAQINADADIERTKTAGQYGYQEALLRQKQQQQENGVDSLNPYNQRWAQLYGKKAPYMTISDVENGDNIPLTDGQAMQILKWMRSDESIDQRTALNMGATDLTNNLVFKQMVADNWDRYGDLVRKMALGQTITKEDQQKLVDEGKRARRIGEYQRAVGLIDNVSTKKGAKRLAALNQAYADVLQTTEPEQEELINIPIAPAGQTAPAVKAIDPISATKIILPVAQSVYRRGESKEQIERDLKALVNSKYKTATPKERLAIYDSLVDQLK